MKVKVKIVCARCGKEFDNRKDANRHKAICKRSIDI